MHAERLQTLLQSSEIAKGSSKVSRHSRGNTTLSDNHTKLANNTTYEPRAVKETRIRNFAPMSEQNTPAF
jgi:hypothetical protein